MDQAKLIDECRERLGVESDYALGKLWGVAQNSISQYRTGKRGFDDYMLHRVAETLDKDPRELTATRELDREPNGKRRSYWEKLLKKFSGATSVGGFIAACIAISAIVASAIPTPTRAATTEELTVVPIMRHRAWANFRGWTVWRTARALLRRWLTLHPTPCA